MELSSESDSGRVSDEAMSLQSEDGEAAKVPSASDDDAMALPSDSSSTGSRRSEGPGGRRHFRGVSQCPRSQALPQFGQCMAGTIQGLTLPALPRAPPLRIELAHVPVGPHLVLSRWAELLREGCHTINAYGTLRRFPATHMTSGVVTRRNKHELPQCLFFDPCFCQVAEGLGFGKRIRGHPAERAIVTPLFAEWLMGLPFGWASPRPLEPQSVRAHAIARLPALAKKHQTLSLFSGLGALDFALSPWCEPVAYCDCCPHAAAVLEARMADGSLPRGPLFRDVKELTARKLEEAGVLAGSSNFGLVFGFPCVDLSRAGRRGGLHGRDSGLVHEAIRLAGEVRAPFLFIENVDNARFLAGQELVHWLARVGYKCRWVGLPASAAGSPQGRRRLFLLAWRGSFVFVPPLDGELPSLVRAEAGLSFNGGRPPPSSWMAPFREYVWARAPLELLGNAVVPLQAAVAVHILSQ